MAVTSNNQAQEICMSPEELKAGKYSPHTLTKVLGALNHDGLVVLKNAIPVEIIDKFNTIMSADADRMIADPNQEYNHGVNSNFLQRPPTNNPECLDKEVYFNSFVLQIANAYLGHRPVWNWCTANTALANTGGMRQPTHKDCNFDHPLFPYFFVANVPLCDFTVENGSTEFWLGSNVLTTAADQEVATTPEDLKPYGLARLGQTIPPIKKAALEERRKTHPPIQPKVCRGDIMIRDIRTWHAGMPNSSDAHRTMLALGYQSPSHPSYSMRMQLPYAQREFFLQHGGDQVDVRCQLLSDEELAVTKKDIAFYTRPAYLE